MSEGPIYEVSYLVDDTVAPEFDAWLEEHVRAALRLAAVADCRVFTQRQDTAGQTLRTCQYLLADDRGIDALSSDESIFPESEVAERFGACVEATARLLSEDPLPEAPPGQSPYCLNCGARLRGQYCGNCGQRSRSRLISLWELVSDAFGDLFEFDSRLWQTLIPLMLRPGQLTRDYLEGRRARFMPPFRMYLVLSLVFFVIAFTNPREKFSLLFAPAPIEEAVPAAPEPGEAGTAAAPELSEAEELRQEIFAELAREGVIVGEGSPQVSAGDRGSVSIDVGNESGPDIDCEVTEADVNDLPGFLARRLTAQRMRSVCERLALDDGRAFIREMIATIPTALIVLLPVMAFVLKVLYPLSRRYYVEHLLFFVHFHAFFFLILSLQILYARFGGLAGAPEWGITLPIVATSLYVPVYLFASMRRVYGQGRLVTFLKFGLLGSSYLAGITIMVAAVALLAAFSV